MFQMYLKKSAGPALYKLEQQRHDRIDQRRRKDPLGSLVTMAIDIDGKKRNIQHQARHRYRRDLRLIRPHKAEELAKRKSRIELDKVINNKTDDRGNQT